MGSEGTHALTAHCFHLIERPVTQYEKIGKTQILPATGRQRSPRPHFSGGVGVGAGWLFPGGGKIMEPDGAAV